MTEFTGTRNPLGFLLDDKAVACNHEYQMAKVLAVGPLDIGLYRDDFTSLGVEPYLAVQLNLKVDDRVLVLLVDGVPYITNRIFPGDVIFDELEVQNGAQFNGPAQFGGSSNFQGNSQFGGSADFQGNSQFGGSANFQGSAQFDSGATIQGTTNATGGITSGGPSTFAQATTFNGTAKFNDKTTFDDDATFNKETEFNDVATFSAGANFPIGLASMGWSLFYDNVDFHERIYLYDLLFYPGHTATTGSANMLINSASGRVYRTTSAARYKVDPQVIERAVSDAILRVEPKEWFDLAEVEENDGATDGLARIPGVIAEDLINVGLGRFVTYDEDGTPDGVMYDRLALTLIPIVNELVDRVEALEQAAAK